MLLNTIVGYEYRKAFIDMGAIKSIHECMGGKEYNLIQTSEFPIVSNPLLKMQKRTPVIRPFWRVFGSYMGKDFLDKRNKIVKPSNAFSLANVIQADYFVLSGCILTVIFFRLMDKFFDKLKKKDSKIIFYGCGGSSYSDFEVNFIRKKLKEIQPHALITRDSMAFQNYSDLADHVFDGIDCAFFVNKLLFEKIEIDMPSYIVLTFDKPENKKIERKLEKELRDYKIIKTCHIPYPERILFHEALPSKSDFVSDSPYDYLNLYAHAEEVHTDRVHACVSALSFGKPCRLYNETPRAKLFEKVCIEDITKRVCYPKNIAKEQEKQIAFLLRIFEK